MDKIAKIEDIIFQLECISDFTNKDIISSEKINLYPVLREMINKIIELQPFPYRNNSSKLDRIKRLNDEEHDPTFSSLALKAQYVLQKAIYFKALYLDHCFVYQLKQAESFYETLEDYNGLFRVYFQYFKFYDENNSEYNTECKSKYLEKMLSCCDKVTNPLFLMLYHYELGKKHKFESVLESLDHLYKSQSFLESTALQFDKIKLQPFKVMLEELIKIENTRKPDNTLALFNKNSLTGDPLALVLKIQSQKLESQIEEFSKEINQSLDYYCFIDRILFFIKLQPYGLYVNEDLPESVPWAITCHYSIEYLVESLDFKNLYPSEQADFLMATALFQKLAVKSYTKAEESFQEALMAYQALGDVENAFFITLNLFEIYLQHKNDETKLDLLKQTLEKNLEFIQGSHLKSIYHHHLGLYYLGKKNPVLALPYFEKAAQDFEPRLTTLLPHYFGPELSMKIQDCKLNLEDTNNRIPQIEIAAEDAFEIISQELRQYNFKCVPPTQSESIITFNYVIKDNGAFAAGISGYLDYWNILHIDFLFVRKKFRHCGLGLFLLSKIESEAMFLGATDAGLDTYDFQAKGYYLKLGYQIFGELRDAPTGHSHFYMHKKLTKASVLQVKTLSQAQFELESENAHFPDRLAELIIRYNASKVPLLQQEPLIPLRYIVREKDEVLAGISGLVYLWNILFIDTLFVKESCRGKGLGLSLLSKIEEDAKERGVTVVHLDTFDWQAKGFFQKFGYAVFGELKDCPNGHSRFYMQKKLIPTVG